MDQDPTAFPIEFDPRVQRMRGTALHGNTPFDVPYMSRITDTLWTGGCTTGLELPPDIEHRVSLYRWESYKIRTPLKSELVVEMYDSLDGPDLEQLEAIARWVNTCRYQGPTLVNCQAGLNRSNLVAARALMLDGMSAQDAIALLREKRSPAVLCNPAFVEILESLG